MRRSINDRTPVGLAMIFLALPVLAIATRGQGATIVTVAGGGTCDGVGTNLGQQPFGLATYGTTVFISDPFKRVVCALDIVTGRERRVAGNGEAGSGGDRGPATAAQLAYPEGVAVDAAGNLYIADREDNRVRKVAAGSGTITTVAGTGIRGYGGDGGPATAAQLAIPEGVAVDAAGNLYIADAANDRVRKVAAGSGTITTVAGDGTRADGGDGGPATAAQLDSPEGVAVDAAGNLYIADRKSVV